MRQAENSKDEMVGYTWYTAAVEYAKVGRKEDAIGSLEKAFAAPAGHFDRNAIASDPALASIASDPRVRQLVARK